MSLWSRIQRQLGDLAGDLLADETKLELEQARELLARDPAAAAELLRKIAKDHPDHALARALLGSAHLELGNPRVAADEFENALSRDDSLPEALLGRGESALALGRPEDAITPYHRAISEAGGDRQVLAEAYRGLGAAYRRMDQLDKAVRELRKAVAENSDDPLARGMLGEALVARGVHDEARRHLRRAGDAEPIPAVALVGLGRLAQEEGDWNGARQRFEAAREALRPGAFEAQPGDVWLGLGEAAREADDHEGARECFAKAAAQQSSAAQASARLGDLATERGEIDVALDLYRQSLERREDDQVLERAVTAAIAGGSAERRSELADRLLARSPEHPRAMVAKALALAERGDRDAARAVLDHAAGLGDGHALMALARMELDGGQLEAAAENTLAALRRDPRWPAARELLADIRQAQLESRAGPSDPRHVTEAGDAACYQLATGLAELLATRAPLAALSPDAAAAAADFDRPLLVTVMGEFSSGKSSFVNAFIGEDIAPTGITPTTATINVVKYGRERGGRLYYQDGRTESLEWHQLESRLRELTGRAAAQIAQVEILLPLEELERVHIVDTPGLNSILPEHETVARDFIGRADAVVWVFAAAQAGKKSERLALEGIREEGKRVLGVLNKVDQLNEDQVKEVVDHIEEELFDLVLDAVVPVSALRATRAKADGGTDDPAFARLESELESRFFARARELKRQALDRRLSHIIGAARRRLEGARSADQGQSTELRQAAERVLGELDRFLGEVVDRERAAMRDAVADLYRTAAREVLDLVRPRRLPFGSNQASPADRDYLIGLLEDGYDALVGAAESRVSTELDLIGAQALAVLSGLRGDSADVSGDIERAVADAGRWVKAQVFGRTGAYVRGYLRGGFVANFFSRDLPKIELDEETVYQALYHGSPDLDAVIALPLAHAGAEALSGLANRLEHLADVADLHGFDLDVGIVRALEDADERRRALMSGDEPKQANTGNR